MRLRVRAATGGATLRVEVPDPGTVYDLRNALSQMIGVPEEAIRLSLNKREEIEGDGGIPLAAFGIRSGDLLYYMNEVVPSLGLTAPPAPPAPSVAGQQEQVRARSDSGAGSSSSGLSRRRELCAMAADRRAKEAELKGLAASSSSSSSSDAGTKEVAKVDNQGGEQGDMEYEISTLHQIPILFSRIVTMERENIGRLQDFLVVALHAVMLETGFVTVGCADNRIAWGSLSSLKYTLPELANEGVHVILSCQVVGDFVVVYGSVRGSEQFHRLSLSVSKFLNDTGARDLVVYKDTFALWKELKDNLTLRLLTLLSEIAGLPLPACFQILPTELKMQILECVTPTDLGIVSCVCSELRFLASSEDLWKTMFLKEFQLKEGQPTPSSWKQAFIREWYSRRRMERSRVIPRRDFIPHFRRAPAPNNPWGVRIIGGDYDIYPGLGPPRGGINPFGGLHRFRRPLNPASLCPLSADPLEQFSPDEPVGLFQLPRPGEDM